MKRLCDDAAVVGVSACLLGREVRYDGGHKRHGWLVDQLGPEVTWVAVCPEVELGLGVPRPKIRLVGPPDGTLRLVEDGTGRDLTAAMVTFARDRADALLALPIDGYVFKSKSPSCGLSRAAVYASADDDAPSGAVRGLFAARLTARAPELPVIGDDALDDPTAREVFVARVRARRQRRERRPSCP